MTVPDMILWIRDNSSWAIPLALVIIVVFFVRAHHG
jgi:hypothetical protein